MLKENLKRLRKEKHLTQKQLAEKIGVTEITIRKYESGDIVPRIKQMCKLSEILECNLLNFINSSEKKEIDFRLLSTDEIKKIINDCTNELVRRTI